MTSLMRVLNLEEQLLEDSTGSCRDRICDALRTDIRGVKRHIDSGLAPGEFQEAAKYLTGLEAAVTVVERVWRSEHGRF